MLRSVRRAVFRVAALLAIGSATQAGCAAQTEEDELCAKLCKKGMKECPEQPRVDCDSQCLYEDARGQDTGCDEHVKDIAKCSEKLGDICTARTACKAELDAFWACLNAWCADHPTSRYCEKPAEG
jgi:hypothetical protein